MLNLEEFNLLVEKMPSWLMFHYDPFRRIITGRYGKKETIHYHKKEYSDTDFNLGEKTSGYVVLRREVGTVMNNTYYGMRDEIMENLYRWRVSEIGFRDDAGVTIPFRRALSDLIEPEWFKKTVRTNNTSLKKPKYSWYYQPDTRGPPWIVAVHNKRVVQAGVLKTKTLRREVLKPTCYTRDGKWVDSMMEYMYREAKELNFSGFEYLTKDDATSVKQASSK